MKKALSIICSIMILVMCLIPTQEFYANTLTVSGVPSSVNIGDEFKVNITCPKGVSAYLAVEYDPKIVSFVSGDNTNGGNGLVYVTGGSWGEDVAKTNTLTFKAIGEGTTSIKITSNDATDVEGNTIAISGTSATVTVANQAAVKPEEPQKSSDNTLSSLKLSSGTLSPSFKKNTTKYTATVGYDVSKVVVTAKANHSKAVVESVTGNGTVNLKVGENTIQIVVRAENGVKKTYTVVVTRKAQETTTPPETESETQSESEQPIVNEMLQWNGEQLQAVEEIPADKIPASFESTLLVVNGQQMPGLSFDKGDLKVLYLNNTNNAGSLYVYDEAQQTIYPFIKLTSEKSYVMVLLPDEQNAPAPEGFESCTFSIEGKGLVSAYQLKENAPAGTEELEDATMSFNLFAPETFYAAEPKASDFYLIYCMNDDGEKGWYMYDSVEETFQRYIATAPSVPVEGDDSELDSELAALQKELNTAKMTQYIIVAIAAAVILILVIVIIVIVVRNRNKEDDFFEGYEDEEDDEYDEEEYDEEDDEEVDEEGEIVEEVDATEPIEQVEENIAEEVAEDDDEIEIEFYEMEETAEVETATEAYVDTMIEPEAEEDDGEIEIEFYEMEETPATETVETGEEVEEEVEGQPSIVKSEPVVKKEEKFEDIKIERRPRVADPTSILSSRKEDDDDLEFIDFE